MNLCLLLVFIGLLCGGLGLAGWAADVFDAALLKEHRDEQERQQ